MSQLVLIAEKRPQDCWDWITPEEVSRMAVRAFEMARRAVRPPQGERFRDGSGTVWAARDDFANYLTSVFELHVKAEAYALGIGGQDYATDAARLQRWLGKGRDPVEAGAMVSPTPSTTNRPLAGSA